MMDLLHSQDEVMLAEAARKMLDDVAPLTRLRAMRDAGESSDPALWAQMVAAGWSGVMIPEGAGGVDMGTSAALILAQEMGRTLATSPFISTAVMAATALVDHPDDLAQIASGEAIWAVAHDEGRSFGAPVCCTATPDGDRYRLNGEKRLVMDAQQADQLLVSADLTGQGVQLFAVATADTTRHPLDMIDARDAAHVTFNNSPGRLIGGAHLLDGALLKGQAALAAEMLGAAQAVTTMTVAHLKDRKQFGVPIGAFQALQHRAAHLWCETELTQSAITHAGRVLDTAERADCAVSVAQARAISTVQLAVREGVQMHGGIGMTDDFDMGFYMRRARVAAHWLGDYGYHTGRVAQITGLKHA